MNRIIKPKRYFTQVSNNILVNQKLSLKAKGLYCYLISKKDDYNFSADRVAEECKEGRKSILSGLKELEDSNYMLRVKKSDGRVDYYFFNFPHEKKAVLETLIETSNLKDPKCHSGTQAPINNKEQSNNNTNKKNTKKNTKKEFLDLVEKFKFDSDPDRNSELKNLFFKFLDMRKKIKKSIKTASAISLNLKVLKNESTFEAKKRVIEKTLQNEWQGLHPLNERDKQILSKELNETYRQNSQEFARDKETTLERVTVDPLSFDTPQAFKRVVGKKQKEGKEVLWVSESLVEAKKKWGITTEKPKAKPKTEKKDFRKIFGIKKPTLRQI